MIDDVLTKHLFPSRDPVGRKISLMVLGPVQIVGVVGHVKHWGLDSDDTAKIRDQIYFPFLQVPDRFMSEAVAGLTLALRTAPDPLSLVSAVRAQVAGPTQDQPFRITPPSNIQMVATEKTDGVARGVPHYPTGASKWNPIEHRLFSEISKNWAGEPLDSHQKILNFIRSTRTQTGLSVTAHLDRRYYPTGTEPTPEQLQRFV